MPSTYGEGARQRAKELYIPGVRGYQAVGKMLGVPTSTVARWINPAYAVKNREDCRRRKQSYVGVCSDCGGPTRYSGKAGKATSERCAKCLTAWQKENALWKRETIIEAVQRWAAEHGRPPHATDWQHAVPGVSPANSTTFGPGRPFATWNDVIRAAGYESTPAGYYSPEEAVGEKDARRAANSGRRWVSNEEYFERMRAAATDGVAASTDMRPMHTVQGQLRRRGFSWDEACEAAGLRSKSSFWKKPDRRSPA